MTEFGPHWDRFGQTRTLIRNTEAALDASDTRSAWSSLRLAVHAVVLVAPEAASWPEVVGCRRIADELQQAGEQDYTLWQRARGDLIALRHRLDDHDIVTAEQLEATIDGVS